MDGAVGGRCGSDEDGDKRARAPVAVMQGVRAPPWFRLRRVATARGFASAAARVVV